MEKTLRPEKRGYKANLHCHSTDSDGSKTPEQLKKDYIEQGYSILAYTDHGYMRDRSALCDENFVALSGYENNIIDDGNWIDCKSYHLNFYAPSAEITGMTGVTESYVGYYQRGKTDKEKAASPVKKFCNPEYSVSNVNSIVKEANERGFLVVYNHPVWSRHGGVDYTGLRGLCGMEIYNNGCYLAGYEEDNGYIYDQMLRDGQKLWCFANDDNHNAVQDSFGGFNVLYPRKLDYKSVFDCIKNGELYASTGAYFRGLTVVGGKVFVGAEDAAYIRMTTNGRYSCIARMKDSPLTEAVFDLNEDISYFRITIKSVHGKKAYTRAYFRQEWSNERS